MPVVVIGAGQSGLAASWWLRQVEIEHVVLERHDVAHSWATERWDSLRLLTPNWLCRLPGAEPVASDPDGFITANELVELLREFAADLPVHTGVTVDAVRSAPSGFVVDAGHTRWNCRAVVSATGACRTPHIPALASQLPIEIEQVHSLRYRAPSQLADGGVLVVGASASGTQIADELVRSGRPVTLAAGRHRRMVRSYRGRDAFWWLETMGMLDDQPEEPTGSRRPLPSMQLVGTPEHRSLDLGTLQEAGVRVVGRIEEIDGSMASLGDDLPRHIADAERQLDELLDRIDAFVEANGLASTVDPPDRPTPVSLNAEVEQLDLSGFAAVVWATGFAPDHPWLDPSVCDGDGHIIHRLGETSCPGLYVLGEPFGLRRRSGFIDGAGPDAEDIVGKVREHLGRLG